MRIAPEGYPVLAAIAGISLALIALSRRLTLPAVVLNAFGLWFFRDPNPNVPPVDDHTVLSPAHGKIVGIEDVPEDADLGFPARRVSIFLSLFSVHVQRSPIRGRVLAQRYNPGQFEMAFREKASELNEQLMTVLANANIKLKIVQIAGAVARRIICHVGPGDNCLLGDRIGIIRFGSRVDLTMPREVVIHVAVGDNVVGGETVIGHLP